jgi:hypothetical protein
MRADELERSRGRRELELQVYGRMGDREARQDCGKDVCPGNPGRSDREGATRLGPYRGERAPTAGEERLGAEHVVGEQGAGAG